MRDKNLLKVNYFNLHHSQLGAYIPYCVPKKIFKHLELGVVFLNYAPYIVIGGIRKSEIREGGVIGILQ